MLADELQRCVRECREVHGEIPVGPIAPMCPVASREEVARLPVPVRVGEAAWVEALLIKRLVVDAVFIHRLVVSARLYINPLLAISVPDELVRLQWPLLQCCPAAHW